MLWGRSPQSTSFMPPVAPGTGSPSRFLYRRPLRHQGFTHLMQCEAQLQLYGASQGIAQRTPAHRRRRCHITRRPKIATLALFGRQQQAEQAPPPPRPNPKFKPNDVRRIREMGPSLADIHHVHKRMFTDPASGDNVEKTYDFVPVEVLGNVRYAAEPQWGGLTQMSFMEFFQGLRERNWTCKYFNPEAERWQVQFFEDQGRFMRDSFHGYRALVTRSDRSQFWVDLPEAGAPSYIEDHMAGGTAGGPWKQAQAPQPNVAMYQYGYNQVFEQIFQAYEQKYDDADRAEFRQESYILPNRATYECPADEVLDVSFHHTAPEPSLQPLLDQLPWFFFYAGAMSFTFACIAIGIFRPRKQMPGDPIEAMEFAQSKGKARKEGQTSVSFSDVAGIDPIVSELQGIVEFLRDPTKLAAIGGRPYKGVLLDGEPGVGKTLIAKAVAGEAGVPFYQMAGSEFVEIIVGVGAARVRDLFRRARVQDGPCIIFVDEIDALGIKRAEAGMETNEEREQTLNQLLSEMDGFTPETGVVFMAATNRPDLLDPALMRAGRFDRKISISRPDQKARADILRVHARGRPMDPEVDLEQLARNLPGFTGADLANLLNEAALSALREGHASIMPFDISSAVDRVVQGVKRPALPDRLLIKRAFAVHEVGRALVASVLREQHGRLEPIERVTMVPRGSAWSRTVFKRARDEDYTMQTRGRLLDRLRFMLAGRAAEALYLKDRQPTTYSLGELVDASRLAHKIVANYGLSEAGITIWATPLARLRDPAGLLENKIENSDDQLFAHTSPGGMWQPADQTLHRIHQASHTLIREAYRADLDIIASRMTALGHAADALLERETLTGEELSDILSRFPPSQPPADLQSYIEEMSADFAKESPAAALLESVTR